MKILFTGELNWKNTTVARLDGLRAINPNIVEFDYGRYLSGIGRLKRALAFFMFQGDAVRRLNRDLVDLCLRTRPDVVWVDKGQCIWSSTLHAMRATGAKLVQHNTDCLWHRKFKVRTSFRLMRETLKYYNIYFTTNLLDLARIRREGTCVTELTYLGFDHRRFTTKPLTPTERETWTRPLLFVGHFEPSTEIGVRAMVAAGLPLRVFGQDWERAKSREEIKQHVGFRQLSDAEYSLALKGTAIGLCFVSHGNGNQTAARSFEIPGSGTFLLAERTPQHLECYQEGVEAEFFGDSEELVRKARFYIDHPEKRKEIAARGSTRCHANFSWEKFMRDDWAKVERKLGVKV
jgi:spore maturation protein CgeB